MLKFSKFSRSSRLVNAQAFTLFVFLVRVRFLAEGCSRTLFRLSHYRYLDLLLGVVWCPAMPKQQTRKPQAVNSHRVGLGFRVSGKFRGLGFRAAKRDPGPVVGFSDPEKPLYNLQ